jgi:hypothetical protein
MIYLAAPYMHCSAKVVEHRVKQAAQASLALLQGGHDIFCPIVHGHYIESLSRQRLEAERWYQHSLSMLARAYELWVLLLPGWEDSRGIALEVAYARKRNKPVLLLTHAQALRGERPSVRTAAPIAGEGPELGAGPGLTKPATL